jgi:hypothetical protein
VFFQRLAIDAKSRRRARLQALQSNLDTAGIAVTVFAGLDAGDRLIHLLDKLAFAVAIAKFQRNVGFLAGAVIRVGEHRCLVLHGMDRSLDVFAQLVLERHKYVAKMSQLLRAHVVLALLRHIGRELLLV